MPSAMGTVIGALKNAENYQALSSGYADCDVQCA